MDYYFEEGDIVIYKMDNSFYKIIEVIKKNSDASTINKDSYIISNEEKMIYHVTAKDIELP